LALLVYMSVTHSYLTYIYIVIAVLDQL